MAVKIYKAASAFQISFVAETKTNHSSGHPSRQQITPGKVAQFVSGLYTTSDSGEQSILDALVAQPASGVTLGP